MHDEAINPVTGFCNWNVLGTYSGCTAVTLIIVRVLDQIIPKNWQVMPIVVRAYIVAVLLLVGADTFLPPPPNLSSIILSMINGLIVAVAVTGSDSIIRYPERPLHEQHLPDPVPNQTPAKPPDHEIQHPTA